MLTITTTHRPATDLGYLLHKHPDRLQTFDFNFGKAHFFYPEATEESCTAAMFLDIDPINLTPKGNRSGTIPNSMLQHYINDRPYTASSYLSVAIAKVLGTAMAGKCTGRPELVTTPIPLTVTVASVHSRYGPELISRMFEPLGYTVEAETQPLDPNFPLWGDSQHHNVTLTHNTLTLSQLLTHLYILLPALDNQKHYWINDDEADKLIRFGEGWLETHPARDLITRRYLKHRPNLYERAQERMAAEDPVDPEDPTVSEDQQITDDTPDVQQTSTAKAPTEGDLERPARLQDLRIKAVLEQLHAASAASVLDLGCGQGDLLTELVKEPSFTSITGLEISLHNLHRTQRKIKPNEHTPPGQPERVKFLHGSLTYRDTRLQGADAAVAMEVIEHIDPPKLGAFEDAVLGTARPRTLIVTTPNREYNVLFTGLHTPFRHRDHRFEWTREEFQLWAESAAAKHGYKPTFHPVGVEDPALGPPTQMAIFTLDQQTEPTS